MYTGRIILTNKSRVPLSLTNDYDDTFSLEEAVMDCEKAEDLPELASKYHRFHANMKLESDNARYTRLSYQDTLGNVHYLLIYKEEAAS